MLFTKLQISKIHIEFAGLSCELGCPPLRVGDEDWFYATVYNGDHAAHNYYRDGRRSLIQSAPDVQMHKRYISLSAGNYRQILITQSVEVTDDTLQLNVDGSRGEVRVGIYGRHAKKRTQV